jgi:hypothetical protein
MAMQVSFAMLKFLADRPNGRARLGEFPLEMNAEEGEAAPGRFIDAVQAGLVVEEASGLRITEAGRSVLRALEVLPDPHAGPERLERSQSLELIHDLIDPEMRQKIFDLGLRTSGEDERSEDETEVEPKPQYNLRSQPELKAVEIAGGPADTGSVGKADDKNVPSARPDAPAFLKRDSGKIESPAWAPSRPMAQSSPIASNLKRFGGILRGHIEHDDVPTIKANARGAGFSGIVLSVLVLLALIICAGTVIAVTQIKSLKSEITTLERQLVPLKKQVMEQPKNSVDQKSSSSVAVADKGRPVAENHAPPPLILSADEVRLVREYIKPAPFNGPAVPPISVGDPVTTGTIPLPSSLMDKVPKLLGARFTIRNGAIIILRRDSHQADAVVGPN